MVEDMPNTPSQMQIADHVKVMCSLLSHFDIFPFELVLSFPESAAHFRGLRKFRRTFEGLVRPWILNNDTRTAVQDLPRFDLLDSVLSSSSPFPRAPHLRADLAARVLKTPDLEGPVQVKPSQLE